MYADNPSTPGAVGQACAAISSTPVSDGISVKLDCPLGVFGRYIKISKTVTRPVWNGGWNSGWHSPSNWHSSSHSSNNPRDCDALLLCEVEIVATPIGKSSREERIEQTLNTIFSTPPPSRSKGRNCDRGFRYI